MNRFFINLIGKSLLKFVLYNKNEKDYKKPDNIEVFNDIPYTTRDGNTLTMNVFKPKSEKKLPVVIDIHGGGLVIGTKEIDRNISLEIASRGYIVCSLEYRLVPEVKVYEQFADICAGIDFAKKYLSDSEADFSRAYMFGESAGGFLAVYSAAMCNSADLQKAVGYDASEIKFKAMALIGGMLYTKKHDALGLLANSFYGKDKKAKDFLSYTNPENSQIINNIAPCLLITSKHDFIGKYSRVYSRALKKNGNDYELLDMGKGRKLKHVFPVVHPEYVESQQVIDKIDEWFKKHE